MKHPDPREREAHAYVLLPAHGPPCVHAHGPVHRQEVRTLIMVKNQLQHMCISTCSMTTLNTGAGTVEGMGLFNFLFRKMCNRIFHIVDVDKSVCSDCATCQVMPILHVILAVPYFLHACPGTSGCVPMLRRQQSRGAPRQAGEFLPTHCCRRVHAPLVSGWECSLS